MRIVRAEIFAINLPMKRPFIVSYQRYDTMPSVALALHTDTGLCGWGESVPDEHVTGETLSSVVAALEELLLPAVLGVDPRRIREVHERMDRVLLGNGAAKAAVDIACHDVAARAADMPLHLYLGGRELADPQMAKVISILPPEEVAAQAVAAAEEGFTHFKLKLGSGPIDEDIARAAAAREALGSNAHIKVDANQGWGSVARARRAIAQLERFDLDWIEQPIRADNLDGFRELRAHTSIPLMADESVVGVSHVRQLIRESSVDYVNLKLMKHGGIWPTARLATQAAAGGMSAQIGSMLESSIASAAGYQLALAHPDIHSTELSGPLWMSAEPGDLQYDPPFVRITDAPGLGINVDADLVADLAHSHTEVTLP